MAIVFTPGSIYSIKCSYINPPHIKYSICISQERAWFLWINTKPRRTRENAQLLIEKGELSFLKYDSYIDTGQFFTFPPNDLNTARYLCNTPVKLRKRIVEVVKSHGHLTRNQAWAVFSVLTY